VGDADRLSQVFTNLVDNAIKHTPAGGFVKLTSRRDGNQILVQVIDSGEGIAPEHLSRIFERFYKVDGSRKQESRPNTGLGLAISQQIILAHDGEIDVRSIPGEGTAFEVLLPATDTNDQTLTVQRRENSG
jgi:signal transduction histidine kinase